MVGEFPETYHNSIQKNDQIFSKFSFLKFSLFAPPTSNTSSHARFLGKRPDAPAFQPMWFS